MAVSRTRLKYKWKIVELRHGEAAKGSPDDVDLNTTLLENEVRVVRVRSARILNISLKYYEQHFITHAYHCTLEYNE